MSKKKIIFNMETADPDDVLTLCMLSHHPRAELIGITVAPGSKHQIGLVKYILKILNICIPVGSKNKDHPKECISQFHYNWLGKYLSSVQSEPDGTGEDIINSLIDENTVIVSGAALSCVSKYIEKYNKKIKEIVIQGGFAGDSVVPEEHRLDKFKGKETCPTFNLNADIPAAKNIISTTNISTKCFVSKNVCHGIIYDNEMHERMLPYKNNNAGLNMMIDGMSFYLSKNNKGKAFHDPLAACVAIDNTICNFAEVELYREKGEWRSKLSKNTNTFISISVNREKFEKTIIS